ncbi:alpha-N-acetylgalactosaminide alpha-2,6-sialyltransferase 2-like isoform X2 [Antedon mediterranea]|uniref:alpha-N-acetylgalactosaminide alpha-2,6-sialyltransferase 2-like isoform X2 n=1 Tax=Antedon mediterranea TaxID=105859 RepID=UPI003AF6D827
MRTWIYIRTQYVTTAVFASTAIAVCLFLNAVVLNRQTEVETATYSPIQVIRRQKINELFEIVQKMHQEVFSTNFIVDANVDARTSDINATKRNSSHRSISEMIEHSTNAKENLNYVISDDDWSYLFGEHAHQENKGGLKMKKPTVGLHFNNIYNNIGQMNLRHVVDADWLKVPSTMNNINGFYRKDISFAKPNCDASLRDRLKISPVFSDRYVRDIPILMYHAMFSPREYYQRKEYPSPFGWENTTYKDINQIMKLLRSKEQRNLFDDDSDDKGKCRRCAVVGKLTSLLRSKFGSRINSYDSVFRSNIAATNGFKEDVGTKTTHYFYTFSSLVKSKRISNKYDLQFVESLAIQNVKYVSSDTDASTYLYLRELLKDGRRNVSNLSHAHPGKGLPLTISSKTPDTFRVLHPDLLRYTSDRWINVTNTQDSSVDLELTMLMVALHTCDEVAVFGLGNWDSENHRTTTRHSAERVKTELLIQLHINKIISLFS